MQETLRDATDNLRDFKQIADKAGMRFMLMEGNLLGAYRDGGFCEGDEWDIDIGIMDDQFWKFTDVASELEKIGFKCLKNVIVDGVFHGGCWERGKNHIDIMRMMSDENYVYNVGEMGRLRYEYSPEIFSKYGKIKFIGFDLETVGEIEDYLEERYGDWKIKIGNDTYMYNNPLYSPNVKRV